MPRIDNSDQDVQEWYEYEFNEIDPGDTPPVDLCQDCYRELWSDLAELDHPSYEDDSYRCFECKSMLTEEDN